MSAPDAPIPRDDGGALADVPGVRVGHATMAGRATGCSVAVCARGATGGVAVRGAAPGTRETDLLDPRATVDVVHAVTLSGGSAFGLAAADGVMRELEARGVGLDVGAVRVPIVPAAVLFDLWFGDRSVRPDAAAGARACAAAFADDAHDAGRARGAVGVGAGASVGKLFGLQRAMRGGLGQASRSVVLGDGRRVTVGAMVAVNAAGDVVDPGDGRIVAGALDGDDRPLDSAAMLCGGTAPRQMLRGQATTIGIVATDAVLTKTQAGKLADLAHDGYALAIRPVHTPIDGDTVFTLATGDSGAVAGRDVDPTMLGAMAVDVVVRAILDAVRTATPLEVDGRRLLPSASTLRRA